MWKCHNCGRIFEKHGQVHSCRAVPIDEHFQNKDIAKGIFNDLVGTINNEIGKTEIISIPCCIHLFGTYDFLAALPKKDWLEIRFSLNRALNNPRIKQAVPVSRSSFKNCVDLKANGDVDNELLNWLKESYHLRDNS